MTPFTILLLACVAVLSAVGWALWAATRFIAVPEWKRRCSKAQGEVTVAGWKGQAYKRANQFAYSQLACRALIHSHNEGIEESRETNTSVIYWERAASNERRRNAEQAAEIERLNGEIGHLQEQLAELNIEPRRDFASSHDFVGVPEELRTCTGARL